MDPAAAAYAQVMWAHAEALRNPMMIGYYTQCVDAYNRTYNNPAAEASAATAAPLVRTTAAAEAPATARGARASEWPPGCEDWAARNLNAATSTIKESVTSEVFRIVRDAKADGSLFSRDWSREPLVESLRAAQVAARDSAASATAVASAASAVADSRAAMRAETDRMLAAARQQSSSQWQEEAAGGWGVGSRGAADRTGSTASKRARADGSGLSSVRLNEGEFMSLDTDYSTFTSGGGGSGGGGGGGSDPRVYGAGRGRGAAGVGLAARRGGRSHTNAAMKSSTQTWSRPDSSVGGIGGYDDGGDVGGGGSGAADCQKSLLLVSTGQSAASAIAAAGGDAAGVDWSQFAVVGRSTILEKRFFRLIGPPDPADVRTEQTLRAAFDALKERISTGADGTSYLYAADQLKAMRQDLAVQHLRGALTVEVYEFNARLALEHGDAAEFNQCSSQLRDLWAALDRTTPAAAAEAAADPTRVEFAACSVLYWTHVGDTLYGTASLRELPAAMQRHKWVRHALAVRAALAADDAPRFFALHKTAPSLCAYLMDMCALSLRTHALAALVGGVRPKIPLDFLQDALGFSGHDARARAVRFIVSAGGALEADETAGGGAVLDTKASTIVLVKETSAHETEIANAGLKLLRSINGRGK